MKVKYKTLLMIAFVSILVCGIEISAKEKRVGAFQFSYVTLDGDNVQITKIIPTQETIPDKLDRKSTRLNSSHMPKSRMPSSA